MAIEPSEVLGHWERTAETVRTACGQGEMLWRMWGEGPPVVLIHGGAGAWSHWIRNLPVLAARYRVFAPDLPGLGESASPPKPYTPESIAAIATAGLREVLGAERFSIVGFSFGGMIAGLMADGLREQLESMIFVGASGLRGAFSADLSRVRRLPTAGTADPDVQAIHRHNLAVMMIHDPSRIDGLAMAIQSINAPRTRVLSPEHALSDKLERVLRRALAPFHSVWGESCIFADDLPRRRQLLQSIQATSQFHIIPGAGHWVQYEAADLFNPLLVRLLEVNNR
ncbi:MAG: alpha/beta hydrolase [Pseudomonadota bacterium]